MSVEQSTVAAVVAGTSGTAAVLAAIGQVTVGVLGVPLPVVLAAVTGAWIARSYAPAKNYFAAFIATLGWTVVGCVGAPLAAWALEAVWSSLKVPTGALAGLALVVAAGMPLVLPIVKEKAPDIVRAWLDKLKGGKS